MKDLPDEVLAVAAEGGVLEEPRDELVIFHLQVYCISEELFPHYCIENMHKIFDQKSIWAPLTLQSPHIRLSL